MKREDFSLLDLNIARARVVLALVGLLSIYVDPSAGGLFHLDTYALATLLGYLAYSSIFYLALRGGSFPGAIYTISTAVDISFATLIALLTEGPTSPSFIFFVFAIVAVGFRTAFRSTIAVTFACVVLYLVVMSIPHGVSTLYIMRAVYLSIAGYLIGFFGQQRAKFEELLREFESVDERQEIARSLHDGYVQALASVTLRLGICRELLQRNRVDDASRELTELRIGVAREYDAVRSYVRSLVNLDQNMMDETDARSVTTRFRIDAHFAGSGLIVEQAILVILEGIRNTWQHGKAASAVVQVGETSEAIKITIDDDGAGFAGAKSPPWAIASRVAECGGSVRITETASPGAHLEIEIPAA